MLTATLYTKRMAPGSRKYHIFLFKADFLKNVCQQNDAIYRWL